MDKIKPSRYLSNDDDINSTTESNQLLNTFYINLFIFVVLTTIFELIRHMKSIFMNRLTSKFINANRVPPKPYKFPFFWIYTIMKVSQDDVLKMIGMDGYMLLRYLMACFRIACFFAFSGILVLVPIYSQGSGNLDLWNKYTVANVGDNSTYLWAPVIFAYLFVIFFCQVMYFEYKNFIHKRVQYLVEGDPDTPVQTYFTVMIERVPSSMKSTPVLTDFLGNIFPGEVFSVEIALDLNELEDLTNQRRKIRNKLEKAIAFSKATNSRATIWVKDNLYNGLSNAPTPLDNTSILSLCGYKNYDAVDHYQRLLTIYNENVSDMQRFYFEQRHKLDEIEGNRLQELRKALPIKALESGAQQIKNMASNIGGQSLKALNKLTTSKEPKKNPDEAINPLQESSLETPIEAIVNAADLPQNLNAPSQRAKEVLNLGARIGEGLAKEGIKTAEYATKGALKGVLVATRALELLTVGAFYRISSTAFVTFKTRVAASCSSQMLLSHEHYHMKIIPAPNPKDLIWENVSIPMKQIEMRKLISDGTLSVGAIFWSIVVAFISAISNLESISEEFPALQAYSNTQIYKFFNNYLAIGILLILLSILPFAFDFISRNYEGLKQESEIQNSIMTRYFYYQLANVFVAVGLGSIANSLHQIISNPSSILSILGNSVPSFSIYFANLIITRTFTGIPIEMLRIFPLLDILRVKLCSDKKKCTRRELRTGAFADPPMLYGWIYPNILMVLMIMSTYCCISPFILPFCVAFFGLLYLMYKYQLLYVYINSYQSGGFMWYAVFDRSMLALLCGNFTLLCYFAIRETYLSGPFYAILPLPIIICLFWRHCNETFKIPAQSLSLEQAKELDRKYQNNHLNPEIQFSSTLFRQPSLAEGNLKAAPYRIHNKINLQSVVEEREDELIYDNIKSLDSHQRDSVGHNPLPFLGESEEVDEVEKEVSAFLEDDRENFNSNQRDSKEKKSLDQLETQTENDPIFDEKDVSLSTTLFLI